MSDLLPPNATPQERALSLAIAPDIDVPVDRLWNPETCPASALPWLAWALSVDEWDASWTEDRKRAVLAASRAVHEQKGTIGALKAALEPLGLEIGITEWWQEDPPADPYTFRGLITVDQEPIPSEAAFDQVISIAKGAKNLRSHITGVDILAKTYAEEFIGGAAWSGEIVTITAEPA